MTRAERAKLQQAVRLLHTDDGYEEGMRILLPLAGLRKPAYALIDKAVGVKVTDLPQEEREWTCPPDSES